MKEYCRARAFYLFFNTMLKEATNTVASFIMARPGGLEPPTSGLEIRCSIQLSYERNKQSLHCLLTMWSAGALECWSVDIIQYRIISITKIV